MHLVFFRKKEVAFSYTRVISFSYNFLTFFILVLRHETRHDVKNEDTKKHTAMVHENDEEKVVDKYKYIYIYIYAP